MLRWVTFFWRALAISISIGILVKTSAEQFRDSYTWSNVTNAFVPVPHKISDKAPCLNKDFFNPSRAAGGTFYINSQCAQDISAYKISGEKMNGFFVDLAAHEWSFISNTLSLEEGSKKTTSASKELPSAAVRRVSTTAASVTPF